MVGLEAALQRERLVVAAALAALVALAWAYLWHMAASMPAMAAMGAPALAMTSAMWLVMMAGMMLPSAAPAILLYGAMVRKHAERGSALAAVWVFVAGYLLVWAAFSLAAALLQAALQQSGLLTPMMASASQALSGALLLAAGLYQLTPLKDACLGKCRNPLELFMMRWRPGAQGALRMGAEHGAYCVGCCGMLMLVLFAAGVMNLLWVALIAAFVFAEKLLPAGRLTSRFAGAALAVVGLALLLRAGWRA